MTVQAKVDECGRQQQGLATATQLMAAKVPRASLARARRNGLVVRVRPGVYARSDLLPWPVHVVTGDGVVPAYVQRVRAVLLSLGVRATAGGRTAACLRGWGLLEEPVREVEVAVPRGRSRVRMAGVRVVQRRRVPRELLVIGAGAGLWVTTAVDTVVSCCLRLPHEQAVVVCDSALRSGQVTLEELREAAARLRGHRAAHRVRRALAGCDPEAGSVLESVLRVRMVAEGLQGFSTQRVVRDASGRWIVRTDFCFDDARLVVEADGAQWHDDSARDRWLDNRLVAAGWRVLRFSWADVVHDPARVLLTLRSALAPGTSDCQVVEVAALAAA